MIGAAQKHRDSIQKHCNSTKRWEKESVGEGTLYWDKWMLERLEAGTAAVAMPWLGYFRSAS